MRPNMVRMVRMLAPAPGFSRAILQKAHPGSPPEKALLVSSSLSRLGANLLGKNQGVVGRSPPQEAVPGFEADPTTMPA